MVNTDNINNLVVFNSLIKTESVLNRHHKILASVSGGSDSDIMIDLLERTKNGKEIEYVWFNTGIEYQATKDHLKYLEDKYGITINRVRAQKAIPTCCREYGQPFLNKRVSDYLERLQRNGFQFEDEPYEKLIVKYPKCTAALKWFCNAWGQDSHFNIDNNKWLREFIIQNPPTFKISMKCCKYAKKLVGKKYADESGADLQCMGIRKAEGGARSNAYKSCFTSGDDGVDTFRPIFYYFNADKEYYEEMFDVKHSRCYTEYGLKRTGCVGCPFGRDLTGELEAAKIYEPNLYKAVTNIFKDTYEYTAAYKEFYQMMEDKSKNG